MGRKDWFSSRQHTRLSLILLLLPEPKMRLATSQDQILSFMHIFRYLAMFATTYSPPAGGHRAETLGARVDPFMGKPRRFAHTVETEPSGSSHCLHELIVNGRIPSGSLRHTNLRGRDGAQRAAMAVDGLIGGNTRRRNSAADQGQSNPGWEWVKLSNRTSSSSLLNGGDAVTICSKRPGTAHCELSMGTMGKTPSQRQACQGPGTVALGLRR
jgi:hypothetical protein